MTMSVEKTIETFGEELNHYKSDKCVANGVVLHMAPVGDSGYYVGTFTCYDANGLKSERALPFDKYIRVVNEIEDLITPYQTNTFTGRLVGHNPTPRVREFLYTKKVHRMFFLNETNVMNFVKNFTSKIRVDARAADGIDVLVIFG